MFYRVAYGCFLLLAGIAASCCQTEDSASPAIGHSDDFQISGTVVDAESGEPLSHARVAIASINSRDDLTVITTGLDGHFLFTGLAPGKYTLTGQVRGHLQQSFNQHDQFSSSIAVGPNLISTDLIFKLMKESSILGSVVDESGEPVREATVALYTVGLAAGLEATRAHGRTATNDQGEYHFSHLSSGSYLVAVSARPWYAKYAMGQANAADAVSSATPGQIVVEPPKSSLDVAYPITFYGGETEAASATPIHLGHGERFTANLVLQPVPAVHMRVASEPGSTETRYIALEQRVLDGPPLQIAVESRALPSGGVETMGVPPGHYTLKVLTAGKSYTDKASAHEIDITGNGGLQPADNSIYAAVSATIMNEGGTLPTQLSVRLLNKKSQEGVSERAGEQGEVVFKQGILPGSYEVSIFTEGETYLKTLSAEGAKVAGRTLEIKPGATVKLKIAIARGFGEVKGVALRNDKPVSGAMILLVPPGAAHNQVLFRRDQSDSDGTFTMANVIPGKYTLLALENGWDLEWTNPEVLRPYLAHGTPLVVQSNAKNDVKLPVQ